MNKNELIERKKDLLGENKKIHRAYQSALLLFESGHRRESTIFLYSTMRDIQGLLEKEHGNASSEKPLVDLLEFQRNCRDKNIWCIDKIDTVKDWSGHYESIDEKKLSTQGIGEVIKQLEILIADLRSFVVRAGRQRTKILPKNKNIIITICAISLLIGVSIMIWNRRPKPFDRDHTLYHYISNLKVSSFSKVNEVKRPGFIAKEIDIENIGVLVNRWQIGVRNYEVVAQSYQVSGGEARDGIWLHGSYDRPKTLITLNNVNSGDILKGFVGVADRATETNTGGKIVTPITMLIYVDRVKVYQKSFTRSPGWHDFSIRLKNRKKRNANIHLEFMMDNQRWSQILFDLWSEDDQ